tara:strand:- start:2192 stop:4180 length:1989 start_codon:yes stop_codon:yes gene_type:complete
MLISNDNTYRVALDELAVYPTWTVDVETNGLDPYGTNQICGIGIGVYDEETENISTFYFPFRHQQGTNLSPARLKELIDLMSMRESLIGYNLKFDLRFLENDGLDITNLKLIDGMILVRLTADSTVKELALTKTIHRFYGEKAAQYDIETKKYLRSNKWSKDFSEAPPDVLGEYCEQDVYWTYKLYLDCLRKVEQSNQTDILNLEYELTKVLYDMENRGIRIDSTYAQQAKGQILIRQERVANTVYQLAGREFNIRSTQEVGEVFNDLGIQSTVLTPKGKESWSEGALAQINKPIAGLVRQHRALGKLASTYLEPYIETSVLHTSFCNWGTLTGRLSSRSPNLQNIPRTHFKLKDTQLTDEERSIVKGRIEAVVATKGGTFSNDLTDEVLDTWGFIGDESYDEDDEEQVSIRRLFIPREGYTLVSFDYSQMEVRVFLSYLQNEEIRKLLERTDVDFHGETAKIAFDLDETHPEYKFYRQMAKSITFGIIYGIGSQKLSQQLRTTQGEAFQYKKKYLDSIEGSREFIKGVMAAVEQRGWIKNKYGRVYKIPSDTSYKGVNYLVQGTSADILNERLIEVHKYLQDKKSNVLLQVHDEIICEIHNSEFPEISNHIETLLEQNSLGIPLFIDKEICFPSWANKVGFTKWMTNGHNDDIVDYIDWSD